MTLDDATVEMLKSLVPQRVDVQENGLVVDLDDPVVRMLVQALASRAQYLNEVGLEYLISRILRNAVTKNDLNEVKNELLDLINNLTGFDYEIVTALPNPGKKGIIYLVRIANNNSTKNIYEEYIWVNDRYELLGSVEFDGKGPFIEKIKINSTTIGPDGNGVSDITNAIKALISSNIPDVDLSGYMPITGGTFTGDVRFQTGGHNYGSVINFGDGDYVHISEPEDDHLEIKGSYINFVTSNNASGRFTWNGIDIVKNIGYIRIYNNYFLPDTTGTVAATTTKPDGLGIALSAIVCTIKVGTTTYSPNTSGQVDLGTISGPTTHTGTTAPAASLGKNDDFYYKMS